MSRLYAAVRRAELEREQARIVAAALAAPGPRIARGRSAPLDRRALRGIPMIGGASGAIPGTVPGTNAHLDRIDRRR